MECSLNFHGFMTHPVENGCKPIYTEFRGNFAKYPLIVNGFVQQTVSYEYRFIYTDFRGACQEIPS